ncbi:hypothetical protein AGMMS49928_14330 [Spirochaetia bacterium]|nr:hypothetical protein AGMMS49928_14330 [Spirochaetia bacterium]
MMVFDVSRNWTILVPFDNTVAKNAAAELARCIGLLRGPGAKPPALSDAAGQAPGDDVPIIVLNSGGAETDRAGFSWRVGRDRIEVYGDSNRGLCNGIFAFLAALGIRWPEPRREELPPLRSDGIYNLADDRGYMSSGKEGAAGLARLAITGKDMRKYTEELPRWAALNRIDALVFSLREKSLWKNSRKKQRFLDAIRNYDLIIEAGGYDLSLPVPRSKFLFHRDLFRMNGGKRKKDFNFCPTNPDTIALLKSKVEKIFRKTPEVKVFHLWPDRDGKDAWCSCPSCRAFSPAEQNRIAVNAAADVLAALDPAASISFAENGEGGTAEAAITLRPNLFRAGGPWRTMVS